MNVLVHIRMRNMGLVLGLLRVLVFLAPALPPKVAYQLANRCLSLVRVELRIGNGRWQVFDHGVQLHAG